MRAEAARYARTTKGFWRELRPSAMHRVDPMFAKNIRRCPERPRYASAQRGFPYVDMRRAQSECCCRRVFMRAAPAAAVRGEVREASDVAERRAMVTARSVARRYGSAF